MVPRRVTPDGVYAAEVVPWEIESKLFGVSCERPGRIFESFVVGSQDQAATVARHINARAARRELTTAGAR